MQGDLYLGISIDKNQIVCIIMYKSSPHIEKKYFNNLVCGLKKENKDSILFSQTEMFVRIAID